MAASIGGFARPGPPGEPFSNLKCGGIGRRPRRPMGILPFAPSYIGSNRAEMIFLWQNPLKSARDSAAVSCCRRHESRAWQHENFSKYVRAKVAPPPRPEDLVAYGNFQAPPLLRQ